MKSQGNPEYKPSVEECAKMGRPFISIPYEPDYALRSLLCFFVAKYNNPISEARLMALSFYVDYRYYQLHNEQFTDLEYKPRSNGMYAKEMIKELDSAPFNKKTKSKFIGKSETKYQLHSVGLDAIDSPDLKEFLEQMNKETKHVSTGKLKEFSKNVPMFKNTDYNNSAEFNDENVEDMNSYIL